MQGVPVTLRRACAIIAALSLAAVLAGAAAMGATSAPNGLVAAYSFDDVSGSTVPDASGGGNNGTLNGATPAQAGRFGAALSFDGVNDFVAVPDAASLDLTDGMTLEAWVKPSALGRSWRTALIKEQATELSYALYAHTGGYGPSGHAYVRGDDERARATTPVDAGTWTHLAVTYDGSRIRLYRDGAQIESRSVGGPIETSSGQLRIGGTQLWSEWFSGLIDEVRVYARALDSAEIQADAATPIGDGGGGGGDPKDTTPPSAPNGLTRTASTPTSVTLGWNAATDDVGVTEYGVYRNGERVATVTGTTATVSGLTCGTTYTFGVDAADAAGNRSARTTATASTSGCSDTTAPTAPPSVSSTGSTTTSISLSWGASSDNVGVAGYGVWNADANAGTTTSRTYTITGLECETTYSLSVDAFDAAGNRSARTTVQTATSPCAPPPGESADRYVSTSGSDAGSCTAAAPCRSFDRAYRVASPGDVVEVAGGTYGSQSIGKDSSKTSATDVVLRPAAGATVTLASLSISGSHAEVRDMRLTRDGSVGSNPIDTRDVTLRNLTGRSLFLRADDVLVAGGSYGDFDGCDSGAPEDGVKLWSDSTRAADGITLDGVRIHDVRRTGCSRHTDCIQVYGGTNHTIENSTLTNCPTTGIIARPASSSQRLENLRIENNYFGSVLDGSEAINIGTAPDRCSGIVVRYNTVVNESSSFDCVSSSGGPGSLVEGNVISVGGGNDAVFRWNVFRPGSEVTGTGAVQCSPSYRDASAGDWRLAAMDSCARGRGNAGSFPATDAEGQARPQGSVDAGADEIG